MTARAAKERVICPTCGGDGSGEAPLPGPTCAAGMCADCQGWGEVTRTKRDRLLARAAGTESTAAILRAAQEWRPRR